MKDESLEINKIHLNKCIVKYVEIIRGDIDKVSLDQVISNLSDEIYSKDIFDIIAKRLSLSEVSIKTNVNDTKFPCILKDDTKGWCLLVGKKDNVYIVHIYSSATNTWIEEKISIFVNPSFYTFLLSNETKSISITQLTKNIIFNQKDKLVALLIAGIIINTLALAISFYTMQVYDRVLPTSAHQTLLVLTIGVVIAILYEYVGKRIRARIFESMIEEVDDELSTAVYKKFVSLRIDQLPQSLGALSSQIKGYESIRSFLGTLSNNVIVDLPFLILFIAAIAFIGKWMVLIPICFFIVLLFLGLFARKKVNFYAEKSSEFSHRKVGLLVETVQGAETIKSGNGRWRMLNEWNTVNNLSRKYDQQIKRVTDDTQHIVTTGQQIAYVSIIVAGAMMIHSSELTMGALIAISILTNRVLTPIASIPNLLIQGAYCKSSIKGLDKLWEYETDNFNIKNPIVLERLKGDYTFSNVKHLINNLPVLSVDTIKVKHGEKVAVIGPIGAGKSSLLKLFTGLLKPTEGTVFIDNLDIQNISPSTLSDSIAFVQQNGRLFSGTLRDNLLLGLIDPGDERLIDVAQKTGLMKYVVNRHPMGLDQPIYEGGTGLSTGQKQLVHLTHAFLKEPDIFILDEPTSSMDKMLESDIISLFKNTLLTENTLILVTHKLELLSLVDRIIVMYNGSVLMDGPRDEITKKLAN